MKRNAVLTAEEKKIIEAKIAEVETRTSGEIVCLVATASSPYFDVRWRWAAIVSGAISIAWALSALGWHWSPPIWEFVLGQLLGASIGFFVGDFPFFKRLLLSKTRKAIAVERECWAQFAKAGVARTKEQTGILIYLSLLERRVQILADKGIHQIVGESFWREEVAQIISGIHSGKTADTLTKVIGQMGDKLAKHFPPTGNNPNELSNAILDADPNGR